MKIVIFLFCLLLFFPVIAKEFTITKSANFRVDKGTLLAIILDCENYGQLPKYRYPLSGVEEIRIVKRVDDRHFFTWTHVKDKREFRYFEEVLITEDSTGKITRTSTYPDGDTLAVLQSIVQLPHGPFFEASLIVWELEEKYEAGVFQYTTVTYNGVLNADSFTAIMFGALIRRSLRVTAQELFAALGQEM